MSDLTELLERVKAATGPDREIDWRLAELFGIPEPWGGSGVWPPFMDGSKFDKSIPLFTASIDAAVGLVERKLPGWVVYDLSQNSRRAGDPWGCTLAIFYGNDPSKNRSVASGYDYPTAPLAILSALLSALIAQGASS